ncbi:uncharacterized protein LOC125061378 isoform X3 [Pieris napi]|uniref:uncharacterized protein LOC125061378 isoform X3 n=1 Tax=Pieris napi TaxID=78633 RepID=UPI001FB9716A|nr:uncharacterized protein LOC125061378 isoform X3 [Pieris napi]
MELVDNKNIKELKSILSKMSLNVCCVLAVPEFRLKWTEVIRGVRNSRLRMEPASVAKVLCNYAHRSFLPEDLADLVAILRLKLVTTQPRTWHVIKLVNKNDDEPPILSPNLSFFLKQALRTTKICKNRRPQIQTFKMNSLVYISVQMQGPTPVYMAVPLQGDVALVSALRSGVIAGLVKGLGYETYEDVSLSGQHIDSLLRIYNTGNTNQAEHLSGLPEYNPTPIITQSGIDYTGKAYDEHYVQQIIGPDPPIVRMLKIKTEKEYFNRNILNKEIKMEMDLKTEDVAKSLIHWAKLGAIPPTSELFHIFHKTKSNNFVYRGDMND